MPVNNTLATRPHALFSFSKLSMVDACPYFTGDNETSDAAERGTNIGEQIALAVINGESPDMPEAEQGASMVLEIMADYPGMAWRAESYLETGIRDVAGYTDIDGHSGFGYACLIEIKTGFGDRLPPPENLQISAQVAGLFHEDPTLDTVYAHLVEVDKGRVYKHDYTRADLPAIRERIANILNRVEIATVDDLNPGKQCKWCGLRRRCTALYALTQIALPAPTPDEIKAWAAELHPDELGQIMDEILPKAELVEVLAGSLKARAMQILEAGGEVDGWAVKRTSGARQWRDEAEIIAVLEQHGIKLEPRIPSPAEAERLAKAHDIPKTLISELAQPGKPRLSLRSTK